MPGRLSIFKYFLNPLKIGNLRKLSFIKPRIIEYSESIESIIKDVEEDFLNLGDGLQRIYSATDDLSRLTRETSVMAGGDEKGKEKELTLSGISAFSEKMVGRLNSYKDKISESVLTLDRTRIELSALSKLSENNDKIITLLNVIALNIAIECNRSERAKEMFSAFVKEVKQLSDKTSEVSKKMGEETLSVIERQLNSQKIISKKLDDLSLVSEDVEKIVCHTSGIISDLIRSSLDSLEKAGNISRDISVQTGKIVIALQFHDIVRQKIEHIVSALKEAVVICSGKKFSKGSLDCRNISTRLYHQ